MLGVSPKTLTRMCDDEEIAYYEYPHGRRFLSADIEAFLARARRPAKEASTP